MTDVNDIVAAKIEAARRKTAADKRRREELAEARRYGLEARRRQKLRNLASAKPTDAVAADSLSVTNGTSLHSVETADSLTTNEGSIRQPDGTPTFDNRTLAASGV
ncbi:hypothetical protein [Streptomyces sp. NPDC005283]|uniref:hypothetical protein n=1 Tax=Streptomyces sp. NPDC005283 TaxID=3156871 RepID=UPI0034564D06